MTGFARFSFGAVFAALFALLAQAAWAAAPAFPKLTGRVVDAAGVLPAATVADLQAKSAALEAETKIQFVVATVPDLQGYEIEDYGYQLGRAWGIGGEASDNGVLLIVAPNERRVRVEVGYGLEPVLTDALSSRIIRDAILPRFRAGDMPGGVVAGADAIITQLGLPPEQARAIAAQAGQQPVAASRQGGISFGGLFWLALIILWVLFSFGRRGGRRHRGSGVGGAVGNIVLWNMLANSGRGSSGWGGGGGFGGGGFSGGGGSFGGGGSSGSW